VDLLQYLLAFVVTLGVLVTFHEFGHYAVARASGVRIVRFAVGFGRPLWSWVDKRGTEFALCAIPLGGYVRMFDDRDVDEDVDKPAGTVAYLDLHPRWRVAIALGGPAANFVLAVAAYWLLAVGGSFQTTPVMASAEADSPAYQAGMDRPLQILAVDGVPAQGWQDIGMALTDRLGETGSIDFQVRDLKTAVQSTVEIPITAWHAGVKDPDVFGSLGLRPAILSLAGDLLPDSAAQRGGLQPGDFVSAVNGEPVTYWEEWVAHIEAHPHQPIVLDVYRAGMLRQLTVTPGSRTLEDGSEVGSLGVYQARTLTEHGLAGAIPVAFRETWENLAMIVSVLKKMITGHVSVQNLSGPISIAQIAGDSAEYGWRSYIGILAFLSLSLGIMNLLPIPILDGGHVVFNGVEWVTGKPVPERVQIVGVQVGLLLVGTTMLFAIYNDILRVF
jgi:regulator of sigma E protease